MKLTKLSCTKCPHTWYPKSPKKPKVCPKCKSESWNKPYKYKLRSKNKVV